MRFWHFGDLPQFPNDRLAKVRLLQDYFNGITSEVFTPGENLSLDESMVLWRGRLIFRQYIKNKKSKYGIKFFVTKAMLKKGEVVWKSQGEVVVVCKWKDKRDVLTIRY